MSYLALSVLSILFIELFIVLKLKQRVDDIFSVSKAATGVMLSKELDDDEKEILVRRYALEMVTATLIFTALFILIGVAMYAFFRAFIYFSPGTQLQLEADFVSPVVIFALTLGAILYVWIRKTVQKRL